jgi:hypothetical protein
VILFFPFLIVRRSSQGFAGFSRAQLKSQVVELHSQEELIAEHEETVDASPTNDSASVEVPVLKPKHEDPIEVLPSLPDAPKVSPAKSPMPPLRPKMDGNLYVLLWIFMSDLAATSALWRKRRRKSRNQQQQHRRQMWLPKLHTRRPFVWTQSSTASKPALIASKTSVSLPFLRFLCRIIALLMTQKHAGTDSLSSDLFTDSESQTLEYLSKYCIVSVPELMQLRSALLGFVCFISQNPLYRA